MSLIPTNAAASIAAAGQVERPEAKAKRKEAIKPPVARPRDDEQDTVVVEPETLEAVRRLSSNEQEDAHQDRMARQNYTAGGSTTPKKGPPALDVNG
ncbi:MAG: hypothetical protein ACKVW3_16895 [Phycisphaerales bacterium]